MKATVMNVMNVTNVNVAEILGQKGAQNEVERLLAAMETNPAVSRLMEAAQSVKDMYQVAKAYINIKLEDFYILMDRTMDFYRQPKVCLAEADMDYVVGGGWWSNFWNKSKKWIIAGVIIAAAAVVTGGVAAGAAAAMFATGVALTSGSAAGIVACTGIAGAVVGAAGAGAAVGMANAARSNL